MTNTDKDVFIYYDSNYQDFILFLFIKLNQDQLKKALPISYTENPDMEYLTAAFVNGSDYLAQNNYCNISKFIKHNNMISIFTNNYDFVSKIYPNLDEKTYHNYLSFSNEQLKI